MCTDRCSVLMGETGHRRQSALAPGERVEDAAVDAHRLVLPIYAMGAQLGEPDVEEVVALCLAWGERGKEIRHSGTKGVDYEC